MSLEESSKQERIEEFLRKSLLGQVLIDTQFHLFSARSVSSALLAKPRVLCANDVLLSKSSRYFLDLLSSDVNASNSSLSGITDANDVPSYIRIEDYDCGSDSDFDSDDEQVHLEADTEAPKDGLLTRSTDRPQISLRTLAKDDDELSEDGSESVSSDMFVMSPEHPIMDPFDNIIEAASVASGKTAVQESEGDKTLASQTAMHPRSLGSRHILIKDTAFQTWYTLLNYLYTDKVTFLPLSSTTHDGKARRSSTGSLDEPRCSAKSMYRLACKVGLDQLRDQALAHIQSNLTEHNVLKELSCSIVTSHPQLLDMELDMLYAHIGSAAVVAGFPALAQRIAHKELPHGAEIIIGIHSRLLKEGRTFSPTPMCSVPRPFPAPPPSSDLDLPPQTEGPCATPAGIELPSSDKVLPSMLASTGLLPLDEVPPPPSFNFPSAFASPGMSPPPVQEELERYDGGFMSKAAYNPKIKRGGKKTKKT